MIQPKLKQCSSCLDLKHIWKSEGKEKYCKECWFKIQPPKGLPRQTTRPAPVSKKMQQTMNEYSKKRLAFLAMFAHCQAKLVGCTGVSTDVHHKAGRGENHNVMSTWIAVCRPCHTWIENHPAEAKELGLSQNRLN